MTIQAPASPDVQWDSTSELRILIVDDESVLTHLLELTCRLEGWAVRSVADGESAVGVVLESAPDVVVLDYMLPGLDGPGVIRSLRAAGIDTPVLMLTARDSIDDRLTAYAAGADDYLAKPFGLEEVVLRIRELVRHRS